MKLIYLTHNDLYKTACLASTVALLETQLIIFAKLALYSGCLSGVHILNYTREKLKEFVK